ncbi:hypothetical protein ACFVXQ_20840, partial [Kitasatospora sp. NPDC058263]
MQPPSRRTLLALGLFLATGGALAACTGSPDEGGAGGGEHRRPDPDEPVRLRAVDATDALLAGYDALLAGAGAGQAGQLQPLRAEVLQHRAALAAGLPAPSASPSLSQSTSLSPSAGGSGSPSGSPGSSSAAAPAPPVATVAALAALERQTAQTRLADLGAASPGLARLLASVSAAGVLHAVALGDTAPAAAPLPGPTDPPGGPATPSGTAPASPDASPAASGGTAGTAPAA